MSTERKICLCLIIFCLFMSFGHLMWIVPAITWVIAFVAKTFEENASYEQEKQFWRDRGYDE